MFLVSYIPSRNTSSTHITGWAFYMPWGDFEVGCSMAVYSENTECEVSIKLYDDDRHEILNETDRATVYADMLEFLDYCLEK